VKILSNFSVTKGGPQAQIFLIDPV